MSRGDMLPPQGLIEQLAKDCRCCQVCHPGSVPCDGLMAGGMCDETRCTCHEDDPDYGWDDEDGGEP